MKINKLFGEVKPSLPSGKMKPEQTKKVLFSLLNSKNKTGATNGY